MAAPDLGKMVGPLPLGAWIAVVGGGLGFALYSRRQAASAPVSDPGIPEDTSGVPGVGTGGSGQWTNVTPPSGNGDAAGSPQTNEEWGRLAVDYLIAQGYSPTVSDSAIRKYLGMDAMSAQEYSLVNAALRHLGSPPQILPPPIFAPPTIPVVKPPTTTPTPVVVKPPPIVKPPAPKPTIRYYYVKPGNTLSGIAKKYYGRADQWGRIYNANRYGIRRADGTRGMIRNPNLILIGWKLIIP